MSGKIIGVTAATPLNPEKFSKDVPDATSVTIAKAEDGTVTITIPMSDGTTDTCVLNPGEDGWPVSATMNGVTKPIEWEGW